MPILTNSGSGTSVKILQCHDATQHKELEQIETEQETLSAGLSGRQGCDY